MEATPTRRLLSALLLLTPPVAAACGPMARSGPSAPEEPPEAESAPASEPDPPGTTVKLLDPGAEPREALRYRPGGAAETLAFLVTVEETVRQGFSPSSAVDLSGEAAITGAAAPGGKVRIQVDVTSVEARASLGDRQAREDAAAAAGILKGAVGEILFTGRGGRLANGIRVARPPSSGAKALATMVRELLGDLLIDLPAEPVGPGARWEVVAAERFLYVDSTATSVVTLNAAADGQLQLSITETSVAARQTIEAPRAPEGSGVTIESSGEGSGEATIRLDRVVPVALTFEGTSRSSGEAVIPGALRRGLDATSRLRLSMGPPAAVR